jgi:peptide/nickel transport system ATP-binding protein
VPTLLAIEDLTVSYLAERGPVRVIDSVSLALKVGESLGVVGESGAGKTILIRAILGLLREHWHIDSGHVRFRDKDLLTKSEEALANLRGKEIALTTPEPRKHLNPLVRVGHQIVNVIEAHARTSRQAAARKAVGALRQVGIPDPERRFFAYPHELSGGMCQRVIIAMALVHSPRLILADEPTAGLDVTISRQILDLMQDLTKQANSSLILVSRDLGVVAHYCQRVAVMHAGRIVEIGDVTRFFESAVHPYSRLLLRAAAAARDETTRSPPLFGGAGRANDSACRYAPRCPIAQPICSETRPSLEETGAGYAVRCHRRREVLAGEVQA